VRARYAHVTRRDLTMLVALGAIWGATYLLNEIALRDLAPAMLIELRFVFASATLLLVLSVLGVPMRVVRPASVPLVVLALGNAVLPFFLIAWGQQYIESGMTGILLALSPLFTAVAARGGDGDRMTGLRAAGLGLSFAGVALLVGAQPTVSGSAIAGACAVVLAALLYAVSTIFVARRLSPVPRIVIAGGTVFAATVLALPAALLQLPHHAPSWRTWAAVAALGVGGTGIAYVLYFALIGGAGASRAILVNYLIPPAAVAYGVVLLGEPLTPAIVGGSALVVGGVALGAGAARKRVVPP
jgi:drug/metabolite transporter (DMT)-like permease